MTRNHRDNPRPRQMSKYNPQLFHNRKINVNTKHMCVCDWVLVSLWVSLCVSLNVTSAEGVNRMTPTRLGKLGSCTVGLPSAQIQCRQLILSYTTGLADTRLHACRAQFGLLRGQTRRTAEVGGTEALSVNFSIRDKSTPAKLSVRSVDPHSYLAGVTAAELQWHLPNMNVIINR